MTLLSIGYELVFKKTVFSRSYDIYCHVIFFTSMISIGRSVEQCRKEEIFYSYSRLKLRNMTILFNIKRNYP